jgi:hypothetical protein
MRKGINATHRHNRVRGVIAQFLRAYGAEVVEEKSITKDLRMDLAIYQEDGKELWIDLTVATVNSKTAASKDIKTIDKQAEQRKHKTYDHEARKQECEFMPLVFDVNSGMGQNASAVIERLSSLSNAPQDELHRAISLAIQVANGRMIAAARYYKRRCTNAAKRDRFTTSTTGEQESPASSDDAAKRPATASAAAAH